MNLERTPHSHLSRRALGVLAALAVLASPPAAAAHDQGSPSPQPARGETVAPFDAQAIDGSMRKVAFTGKGSTVLLFFLSSCPTCHRMIPEWNRAYERRPQGLEVIGVLMDREPPGFFMTMPVAFPVVRAPSRDFLQKMKVTKAPLMVRVAKGGRIEDVALGYTDPIRVGEIFRP